MNDGVSIENEFGFNSVDKPNCLTNSYGPNDPRDPIIPKNFREDSDGKPYLIEIDGDRWTSIDSYFHAGKFAKGSDAWKEMKNAVGAGEVFTIDLKYADKKRSDWEDKQTNGLIVKEEVMLKALCAKFAQNTHLMDALLSTGNVYIAQHNPTDDYWGSLPVEKGPGQNRLGIMLTEMREAAKRAKEKNLTGQDLEIFLFKDVASTIEKYPPNQDLDTARTSEPLYKKDYMEAHPELSVEQEKNEKELESEPEDIAKNPTPSEGEQKKKKKLEAELEGLKDNQDFDLPAWMTQAGWVKEGNDYFRSTDDPEPAFSIKNNKITLSAEKAENIVDMIRLLKSQGAGLAITAKPHDVEAAMVYLEAQRQGVTVKGFKPNAEALQKAQAKLNSIQAATPDLVAGAATQSPPEQPEYSKHEAASDDQDASKSTSTPSSTADENVSQDQQEDNPPSHDFSHDVPLNRELEKFWLRGIAQHYQRNGNVFTKKGVPAFSHDKNNLTLLSQAPAVIHDVMIALRNAKVPSITLAKDDPEKNLAIWHQAAKVGIEVNGFEPHQEHVDAVVNDLVKEKGKTLRSKNGPPTMTHGAEITHELNDGDIVQPGSAVFVDHKGNAYVLEISTPPQQKQKGQVKCVTPEQQKIMGVFPIVRGQDTPLLKIGDQLQIPGPAVSSTPSLKRSTSRGSMT